MQARAVALKTRPEGMPTADNFQIIDIDVPEPQDGEIQVENICMSVDPYMRGRMYDRKSYVPPLSNRRGFDRRQHRQGEQICSPRLSAWRLCVQCLGLA